MSDFGKHDLARVVVNGTYSGPTHRIAARLLDTSRLHDCYVVEQPNDGAMLELYSVRWRTLLECLEHLAEIGGERLEVDGERGVICFEPLVTMDRSTS
jgi:hypothetical protein